MRIKKIYISLYLILIKYRKIKLSWLVIYKIEETTERSSTAGENLDGPE